MASPFGHGLVGYAIASFAYRLVVMLGIALYLAGRFFTLGVAALVLAEPVGGRTLAGGLLVIVGVLLVDRGAAPPAASCEADA